MKPQRHKPTYYSWHCMRNRCTQPSHQNYHRYGGRGIRVCERWNSFENFLADMGERPEGMTLDRFPNPDGNYEPGNCRWATQREQTENRGRLGGSGRRGFDITGERFGRLVAVEISFTNKSGTHWLCNCDCGNTSVHRRGDLKYGYSKSCGCSKEYYRRKTMMASLTNELVS